MRPPAEILGLRDHQIQVLPFSMEAALQIATLPPHHKDPFDRMLVCQAVAGGFTILTPDPEFQKYAAQVVW